MLDKQPADNVRMAIIFASDLLAGATINGNHLVIENLNPETMVDKSKPNEVRIPIVNGMVSQSAVEQALERMSAYTP